MSSPVIVVGAGFSGAVLAREIAENTPHPVTVIERRPHIAGNMYDERDEHGILVQRYGPHFLNTDHYEVISYLARFADLFPHVTKLLSVIDGVPVRLPFNFQTVQELLGAQNSAPVLAALRSAFPGRDRVPVLELVDCADPLVSRFGKLLFEKAYRTYVSKMWDIPVEKIDKYVLDRVPFCMGYDERYLNRDFQYLPKDGFTALFTALLDHPAITVRTGEDALPHITLDEEGHSVFFDGEAPALLVYTGPIDELFSCRYGDLPYRSLDIRYSWEDTPSRMPAEILSFPQAEGKTRSTEYRKMMFDDAGARGSVIATEYPLWYKSGAAVGGEPFYPARTDESVAAYERYRRDAERYGNLLLAGRLATFRYLNMDECILEALSRYDAVRPLLEG